MSFSDLITLEHQNSPKFVKTVKISTAGYQGLINLCHKAYKLYDLDTATGVQLDAVGEWIGQPRVVRLYLFKYFSWDTYNLGWDEAPWWEEGQPRFIIYTMPDKFYRRMLKNRILVNHFDGTLPCAVRILRDALSDEKKKLDITVKEDVMDVTFKITGGISKMNKMILHSGLIEINPGGVFVNYDFGAAT